jgi:ketosteroid isomerase-like protein
MPSIGDALSATNGVLINGLRTGDAAACAAAYTTDARVMFQHTPTVTGRDAIQAFWQGVIDMGAKNATLDTDELLDFGDTQVDRGRYTLTLQTDDGEVTDEGKYVVVWKQDGEAWRIFWDSFSSDLPA